MRRVSPLAVATNQWAISISASAADASVTGCPLSIPSARSINPPVFVNLEPEICRCVLQKCCAAGVQSDAHLGGQVGQLAQTIIESCVKTCGQIPVLPVGGGQDVASRLDRRISIQQAERTKRFKQRRMVAMRNTAQLHIRAAGQINQTIAKTLCRGTNPLRLRCAQLSHSGPYTYDQTVA